MQVIHNFLTPNEYSRPQKRLHKVMAIVLHWVESPNATASDVRNFFESKKTGMGGYGSAHYIIGQNGIITAAIPEDEIAYHCGSSRKDPVSGQVYTDYARAKFAHFATEKSSPNLCTIGIELCHTDWAGNFTTATINSAVELCADLCLRYELSVEDITTHHAIVGWKNCPKLWTEKPHLFEAFKASVKDKIERMK